MSDDRPDVGSVFIALGSNIGDRNAQIHSAIDLLDHLDGFNVDAIAPIYQSAPMYVLDQPAFLNTALVGHSALDCDALLRSMKEIEEKVGRQKTFANGPRVVDLDIVYFDAVLHDEPTLTIPHPRRLEREFVLQPVVDLNPDFIDPLTGRAVSKHLDILLDSQTSELSLYRP